MSYNSFLFLIKISLRFKFVRKSVLIETLNRNQQIETYRIFASLFQGDPGAQGDNGTQGYDVST